MELAGQAEVCMNLYQRTFHAMQVHENRYAFRALNIPVHCSRMYFEDDIGQSDGILDLSYSKVAAPDCDS